MVDHAKLYFIERIYEHHHIINQSKIYLINLQIYYFVVYEFRLFLLTNEIVRKMTDIELINKYNLIQYGINE